MSTFLVSLGVVAATIAAVIYVVLNGPDQPATIRRQPSRAKERRQERTAAQVAARAAAKAVAPPPSPPAPPPSSLAPSPIGPAAGPSLALPDSDVMRLRVLPARRTTLWVRVRSFVTLVVLVAVLGALLAVVIGGVLLGVVLLVRSATS